MAHDGTIAGMYGVVHFGGLLNSDAVEFNCRNWTIDWVGEVLDVTTFDSTVGPREFIGGLTSWSGSFECLVDKNTNLNSTFVTTTAETTAVFQTSDGTDFFKFAGALILTGVSVSVAVDGLPVAACTFQGNGTLTPSIS